MYGGTKFVMGKSERHVFLDLGIDGNIRLKRNLKKEYGRALIRLRTVSVVGYSENCNELMGSIILGKILLLAEYLLASRKGLLP